MDGWLISKRTKCVHMKCLGCQYDLSAITSDKCPECGRSFDKRDPMTFDARETRPLGRLIDRAILSVLATFCCCAILHIVTGYIALVAARIDLGRWPHRMGRDDPKYINWFVSTLHLTWFITAAFAFVLILFAVPLVPTAIFRLMQVQNSIVGENRRLKWTVVIATVVLGIGLIVDTKYDPARIGVWMLD